MISCIMPTANRPALTALAIQYFLRQTYEDKELIIIADKDSDWPDMDVPDNVKAFLLTPQYSLGNKRNYGCFKAQGDVLVNWDSDDYYAPYYLDICAQNIQGFDITGTNNLYFYEHPDKAWEFKYPQGAQPYVVGSGMCFTRDFWKKNKFPDLQSGEDTVFVGKTHRANPHGYKEGVIAMIHGKNTCSHLALKNKEFSHVDPGIVRQILGGDINNYSKFTLCQKEKETM